jgi:hypothetical protein
MHKTVRRGIYPSSRVLTPQILTSFGARHTLNIREELPVFRTRTFMRPRRDGRR